ncbi:MAG: hypothetical protein AB7W59_00245 [Acidimicrobiia bacterium]
MATMIEGYVCPGCGQFHKYPSGFAALRLVPERTDDGIRIMAIRHIHDAVGRPYHVVEHSIRHTANT